LFKSQLLYKKSYGIDVSGEVKDDLVKNFRNLPNDRTNDAQEAMAHEHELADKQKKDSGEPQRVMKTRRYE